MGLYTSWISQKPNWSYVILILFNLKINEEECLFCESSVWSVYAEFCLSFNVPGPCLSFPPRQSQLIIRQCFQIFSQVSKVNSTLFDDKITPTFLPVMFLRLMNTKGYDTNFLFLIWVILRKKLSVSKSNCKNLCFHFNSSIFFFISN